MAPPPTPDSPAKPAKHQGSHPVAHMCDPGRGGRDGKEGGFPKGRSSQRRLIDSDPTTSVLVMCLCHLAMPPSSGVAYPRTLSATSQGATGHLTLHSMRCPSRSPTCLKATRAGVLPRTSSFPDRVWAQDPGTPGYRPGEARLHCLETTAHDPQSLLRGHGCHCRFPQGSVHTSFPKETCFFVIPSF